MVFRIIPTAPAKRAGERELNPQELHHAIQEIQKLAHWPDADVRAELAVSNCRTWKEARLSGGPLRGELRIMFWVCPSRGEIYILDVFWKKTQKLRAVELTRSEIRLRKLKKELRL